VFERFRGDVLSNDPDRGWWAAPEAVIEPDVVIELPFNPPGRPRRFEGRPAFLAYAGKGRVDLPVRFDEFRDVVIHETADPEVIVAEYQLAGTVRATGESHAANFVLVLRVRDGRVTHVREYQDVPAMARALGVRPAAPSAGPEAKIGGIE
jgi:hypothetical protein